MSAARTLVALATFNEIDNLPSLVSEILRVLPQADVLVVDDNSPDGTGGWCEKLTLAEPRLHCIHRPGKLGLGTAAVTAIQYAIDNQYDLFVTLDADWSHDPGHLPALLKAVAGADVAIGSRYCPGGDTEGWPWRRRIMSRWINRLSQAMLRMPVLDASGAFRAYRVSKLRELDLRLLQADGYAYLEEILWHLDRAGASFTEVPITFHERRAGQSKISLGEAAAKLIMLFRLASQR